MAFTYNQRIALIAGFLLTFFFLVFGGVSYYQMKSYLQQEMTAKQQREAAQQQFLDEHPDFIELMNSGKLDPVKKSLPGIHDDFSAYFAYQAQQATAAAEEQKRIDKIAQGAERTDKVLQKPGAKAKDIGRPNKKMTASELKAHTLQRLDAMG